MKNLVLDPGNCFFGRFRNVLRITQVLLVDEGEAGQRFLPDLELLVEGSLLHEVEKIFVLGHQVKVLPGGRNDGHHHFVPEQRFIVLICIYIYVYVYI